MNSTRLLNNIVYETSGNYFPKWLTNILIPAAFIADMVLFYQTFDLIFSMSMALVVMSVIFCVATCDLLPIIYAKEKSKEVKTKESIRKSRICFGACAAMQAICFAARMFSMSQLYGKTSDISFGDFALAQEVTYSGSEIIGALMLAAAPIGTSLICYYITYKNEMEAKKETTKKHIIELQNKINEYETGIEMLERALEQDYMGNDRKRYEAEMKKLYAIKNECKYKARLELAKKLGGRAEDITTLLDENILPDTSKDIYYREF